mmetsp:Transcript_18221/g.16111  ORF Transcript_18221/g.16111 Transcript_18221/m.16111 type:complete len:84 (+) Transcript_18221:622-873(+)
MMSNKNRSSFRKNYKISNILDRKAYKGKEDRYKPFNIREYTKSSPLTMKLDKRGGLGPEIGGKRWQEERQKRERMRDFSERIG